MGRTKSSTIAEGQSSRARGEKARGKQKAVVEEEPEIEEDSAEDAEATLRARRRAGRRKVVVEEEPEVEEEMPVTDEPTLRVGSRGRKKTYTQSDLYDAFSNLTFKGTRYADMELLVAMGIYEDVERIFSSMGMQDFWKQAHDTYREPTCQFFSSLKVRFYDWGETHGDDGYGYITFKIGRRSHRVSFRELNTIYGFFQGQSSRSRLAFPPNELHNLWETIGVGKYKVGALKSANIKHPAIRYVHKVIAHTFYARKECGYISEDEMGLLDKGLLHVIQSLAKGYSMNGDKSGSGLLALLLEQFLHYQNWAMYSRDKNKTFSAGGIITPILIHCGVELRAATHAKEFIDVNYLNRTKFLAGKTSDGYAYRFAVTKEHEAKIILPCLRATNLQYSNNARFTPNESLLYDSSRMPALSSLTKMGQAQQEAEEDETAPPLYGSARYCFHPYDEPIHSPFAKAANEQIKLLQRWNKWQDKTIRKLVKSVKGMKSQIKELTSKLSGGSSSRAQQESDDAEEGGDETDMVLDRRHSFHVPPQEEHSHEEQPRSSSYESRRRKRRAVRSPTPGSSNPSYSVDSTSASSIQF